MNETTETTITAAPAATAPAAEAAATTATELQPAGADAAQGAAGQPPSILQGPWFMILLMLAIFYFMMIRPQQRKEKERRKMIEELRAGAKVVFAGGIFGTIVEATEKAFLIETADGSKMEVLRSSVQGVVGSEAAAEAAK